MHYQKDVRFPFPCIDHVLTSMLIDRKKTETIQVLAMMQTRYYVDSVSLYILSQGANSIKWLNLPLQNSSCLHIIFNCTVLNI